MKKIRVTARVYDKTTHEYVQSYVTREISDEFAEAIKKEFACQHDAGMKYESFGHGRNGNKERLPFNTPLASQRRYWIDPMFHLLDDDGNEIAGWRGI